MEGVDGGFVEHMVIAVVLKPSVVQRWGWRQARKGTAGHAQTSCNMSVNIFFFADAFIVLLCMQSALRPLTAYRGNIITSAY